MIALDIYGIFAKLLKIFSLKINWSENRISINKFTN